MAPHADAGTVPQTGTGTEAGDAPRAEGFCRWTGRVEAKSGMPMRLDRYAAEQLGLLSRSQLRTRSFEARVGGKPAKISRLLKGGEFLELFWKAAPPLELLPEDIPLEIRYEDRRVIVLDKAQGMVVHPGAGNHGGTLANALLWRRLHGPFQERTAPVPGDLRPGIVHRLDRDTSGILIAAWDGEAHEFLARQFAARAVRKCYAAIVSGAPPEERGTVDTFIARDSRNRKLFAVSPDGKGKRAVTRYRLVRAWQDHSLVLLYPRTGRTHQLRVHLRHLGCPVLGDPLYGIRDRHFPGAALMLHALTLEITLPGSPGDGGGVPPAAALTDESPAPSALRCAGRRRRFSAPLPERFREIFRSLGKPHA